MAQASFSSSSTHHARSHLPQTRPISANDEYGFGMEVYALSFSLFLLLFVTHGLDLCRHRLAESRPQPVRKPICQPLLQMLCDIPEAGLAVMIGAITGAILQYGYHRKAPFSPGIFFYLVLPPIVFYQGYSLKKRNWFRYLHYIMTLGCIGTLSQFAAIIGCFVGLSKFFAWSVGWPDHDLTFQEVLLFCSVMVANDEVATLSLIRQEHYPKLSALLFGEGVVNDAGSILIFRTVLRGTTPNVGSIILSALELFFLSTAVGLVVGLALCRYLKVTTSLRDHPTRQSLVLMIGCYMSYSTAELLSVPGVLAVFFCGVTFSHFAWYSLAYEARVGTAIFSRSASTFAETYSFLAVGLSIYKLKHDEWSIRYAFIMCLSILIARALVVFGTFAIGSLINPKNFSLSFREQFVLFWGGSVRGAITWAQAQQIYTPHKRVLLSSTLAIIVVTLLAVGSLTGPLLRLLGFDPSSTTDMGEIEGVTPGSEVGTVAEEDVVLKNGDGSVSVAAADGEDEDDGYAAEEEEEEDDDDDEAATERDGLAKGSRIQTLKLPGSKKKKSGKHNWLYRKWYDLDEKYFKPFFGGRVRKRGTPRSPIFGVTPELRSFRSFASNSYGSAGGSTSALAPELMPVGKPAYVYQPSFVHQDPR